MTSWREKLSGAVGKNGKPGILDAYVTTAPSPQNAIGIFEGEWASSFPEPLASIPGGPVALFSDPRITWMAEMFGGLAGKTVLELGPLEGGHSYMLDRMGARSVLSVEANTRAFLRCLVMKELLGMDRVHFVCGDFVEYLRGCGERFDVVLASGVLYHMRNPIEVLSLVSRVTDRVLLWTHHYEPTIIGARRSLRRKFTDHVTARVDGFEHTLHRQEYKRSIRSKKFCGGSAPYSNWVTREDILGALRHLGYTRIDVAFDQPDHQNGPAFAVAAQR